MMDLRTANVAASSKVLGRTTPAHRAGALEHPLQRALDWLSDGVAVVDADRRVLYANEAFVAIARTGDGIVLRDDHVDLADAHLCGRFAAAIARTCAAHEVDARADFRVQRRCDAVAYLVSVRPLRDAVCVERVSAIFVHNPAVRGSCGGRMLREVFAFTDAEASLAGALQAGMSPTDYARAHRVSINTVYTHLRHIKEKTGCQRLSELICRLNELRAVPVNKLIDSCRTSAMLWRDYWALAPEKRTTFAHFSVSAAI